MFFLGVRGGVSIVSYRWPLLGRAVGVPLPRFFLGDTGVAVGPGDMLSALVSVIFNVVEAPIGGSLTSLLVCSLATELDSSISSSPL
jgi:hypothetical protein